MFQKIFAFLLILLPILTLQEDIRYDVAKLLQPGETHIQEAQSLLQKLTQTNRVQIFCQTVEGSSSFWRIFQSSRLHLEIEQGAEYNQYKAESAIDIYQAHRQQYEWNESKAMTGKDKYIDMKANYNGCYGIYTEQPFNLTLGTIHTDKWRVTKFCLGLILWHAAPRLEDSHRCLYSVAAFLALPMATWIMSFITGHSRLALGGSMWTAFNEVLYERPSTLALAFSGCLYALVLGTHHLICENRRFRNVHRLVIRGIACWMIFTASDHQNIGAVFVFCLFYVQIMWLLRYLYWSFIKCLRPLLPPPDRQQHHVDISQLLLAQRLASNRADGTVVWAVWRASNTDPSNGAGGTNSMPIIPQGNAAFREPNFVPDHPNGSIFRDQDGIESSDTYGSSMHPFFRGHNGPNDTLPMNVERPLTSRGQPRRRRNTFSETTLYSMNMNYRDSVGHARAQW